ncbi:MAG: aminotransferase class V-fold PLP-dependent enzyme [Clostridiales bacterium]|jgi:cysteine desulfurase family protein|nr:aminotransferase class V-fold PLP-dependent enzyme [Clostridiales bacterium]
MVYLDNAATSKFKPPSVVRAVVNEIKDSANPGRGAHADSIRAAAAVMSARDAVRAVVGHEKAEVVFTKNCTEAINLAVFGTLKEGGHVIAATNAHNSVLRPLHEAERAGQISLTVVEPKKGGATAEDIERALRPDTYLVCINHVSNVTGTEADIEAIGALAARQGFLFLADCAQSLGHIPVNMKKCGVDMLASAGHKGLHGPQGTGFLAFRPMLALRPLLFGGTGTESDSVYQPATPPEAFESGTVNTPGICGLREGIIWTLRHQTEIREKIKTLSSELIGGLSELKNVAVYTSPSDLNGVVTFNIDGFTSSEVGDILNERYGVAVRTGLHCAPLVHKTLGTLKNGAVRAGIGCDNTSADIKKLLAAVKEIPSLAVF